LKLGNYAQTSIFHTTVLLFILTIFRAADGQSYMLRGRVFDNQTGEPLVAANIQIVGTYRGTISNENGRFQLEILDFPADLSISYIGYQTRTVELKAEVYHELEIRLEPVIYEAEPIVVIAEDPGMQIMREVIRRKQEWIKEIHTYRAEAYSRMVLENDSGIVSISESTSELFWDAERGPREIIKSKRQTSNIDQDQNFAFASYIPNLYADDVEINGFSVIGPTNPDAFDYYEFMLEKTSKLDTTTVFHIKVIPVSRLQPTFTGELTVLDHQFVLFSADLKPSENILFPPPIQSWDLSYRQKFSNFGRKFWLPVDLWVTGAIKISFPGLEFPRITYKRIASLTDYEVNVALPDSLYADNNFLRTDTLAVDSLTIEEANPNPIPLSDRESTAYQTLDSTATLIKAFKPTGFLSRFIDVEDGSTPDSSGRGLFDIISPVARFNRVEGLHIGASTKQEIGKTLSIDASAAYNTGLRRGGYTIGALIKPFPKTGFDFGLNFSTNTETRYRSENYSRLVASLPPLFAVDDYFDYFWQKSAAARMGYLWHGIETRVQVAYNWQEQRSLQKTTDFNIVFSNFVQRPNPSIDDGTLRSLEITLQYGNDYVPFGVIGQKRILLTYEKSLSGAFNFSKVDASLDWRIKTFLTRRLLPNVLDLHIVGGSFTGTLPVQRFGIVDAGLTAFGPFGVLKSLRNRPYEGEKYLAFLWEHNFRTVPFELLNMDFLYKNGISLLIFGGLGRTWISDQRLKTLDYDYRYTDEIHTEIGISVSGIFDLLRIDLTQRLDRPLFYVGIAFSRFF
jgi:hypothetical protein